MSISGCIIHDIRSKIANIVMYIKFKYSLTVNGDLIIRCNYKTKFIGMIIFLYSVIGIFDTWIIKNLSIHY